MNQQPIEILLVEDNPDHRDLILMTFQENHIQNNIHYVSTGEAALDFLHQRGNYQDAPHPGLILLDIKLPGISGVEVLEKIKDDQQFKMIPVVMLTTSANDKDIVESYGNGANSYVVKPVEYEQFVETLRDLQFYWVITNHLPV